MTLTPERIHRLNEKWESANSPKDYEQHVARLPIFKELLKQGLHYEDLVFSHWCAQFDSVEMKSPIGPTPILDALSKFKTVDEFLRANEALLHKGLRINAAGNIRYGKNRVPVDAELTLAVALFWSYQYLENDLKRFLNSRYLRAGRGPAGDDEIADVKLMFWAVPLGLLRRCLETNLLETVRDDLIYFELNSAADIWKEEPYAHFDEIESRVLEFASKAARGVCQHIQILIKHHGSLIGDTLIFEALTRTDPFWETIVGPMNSLSDVELVGISNILKLIILIQDRKALESDLILELFLALMVEPQNFAMTLVDDDLLQEVVESATALNSGTIAAQLI